MSQLRTLAALISENAVPDARGLFSVVAIEPLFWTTVRGAQMAPTMTVIAEDDDEEPFAAVGSTMVLRLTVNAPNDEILYLHEVPITVEPKQDSSLPRRFQVIAPLPFSPTESGVYQLGVTATSTDHQHVWERELRIRVEDPPT